MNLEIRNFLRGPYILFEPETGIEHVFETAVPHKWLPGDTVLPTGEVRARGSHRSVVGIIDFCNRIGQGFTSRGAPLYLFHPLDSGYPPFLVSAKTRPASNMLALVNYEHWDGKWPRGGIQIVLGAVGDKKVEKQALQLAAKVGSCRTSTDIPSLPTVSHSLYDDTPWDIVCNIDPDGCEDVDDVFAWRADGTFAVGIADVSAFVEEGSALDLVARSKGTSVYENTMVVDPMLPSWLSGGAASLLADGVARPVLALVWAPAPGAEPEWRRLLLTVNRRHSYESVLTDSEVCFMLPTLLTRILGSCDADPHEWVAAAMVEYNRRAGDLLAGAGRGLLRVHSGAASSENIALAAATGCRALAWRGASAGFYVSATSPVAAHGHAGLGLSAYAHASSPLRRYADLMNQRFLKHILGYYSSAPPSTSMTELAFHLNARARVVREYELRVWFLSALRTDAITNVDAVCCEFRGPPVDAWTVYVPVWRRFVRARTADGIFPKVGQVVKLRAFCDLREVAWDRRCVCQIAGPK